MTQLSSEELEKRIEDIVGALKGMKNYQWARVQQHIEMMFSSQADKVEIDDLGLLKENLRREFRR